MLELDSSTNLLQSIIEVHKCQPRAAEESATHQVRMHSAESRGCCGCWDKCPVTIWWTVVTVLSDASRHVNHHLCSLRALCNRWTTICTPLHTVRVTPLPPSSGYAFRWLPIKTRMPRWPMNSMAPPAARLPRCTPSSLLLNSRSCNARKRCAAKQ